MSAVYLETSALLRVLFREPEADRVRARLASAARVVSSRLTRIEAERALLRLRLDRPSAEHAIPELRRQLRSLWARVDFLEMSRAICDRAGAIASDSRLRSLDAIHLATFESVREAEPAVEMLSFDQRVLDAV